MDANIRLNDLEETMYGVNGNGGITNRVRDLEAVTYGRETTKEAGTISKLASLDAKVSEVLRKSQAQRQLLIGVSIGLGFQMLDSLGLLGKIGKLITQLLNVI